MVRILLVRHGAFDGIGHVLAGRSDDVHLNDEGQRQAAALHARIGGQVASVTTSPRTRARETATAIATPRGLACSIDHRFDEFDFGDWSGRAIQELASDPLWRDFNRMRALVRAPGGEMFVEMQARALAGLHALRESAGDVHVVVTHADVVRALLAAILQMPPAAALHLDVDPASITEVSFHGNWPQVRRVNG